MLGFTSGAAIGAIIGAIVIGVIANRRPQTFANVVSMANHVDAIANAKISATVDASGNAVQQAAKKL